MKSLLGVFVTLSIFLASLTSPSDASPVARGLPSQLEACSETPGKATACLSPGKQPTPSRIDVCVFNLNNRFAEKYQTKKSFNVEQDGRASRNSPSGEKRLLCTFGTVESIEVRSKLNSFCPAIGSVSLTPKKTIFKNQARKDLDLQVRLYASAASNIPVPPWRNWNIQDWPRKNDGDLQPLDTGRWEAVDIPQENVPQIMY
ncbi:hypothetical protein F5050DRAFT_1715203 [Lentinula boryana]|uniref:Uncharacterized protein n=1 Tax=Lentinula boryana TaxID=40481 RepID=A0ABQ8Q1Q2_9AGAR|nr:hypothetical protein F5050DRAFT_1715203 [Lentinula boryana]